MKPAHFLELLFDDKGQTQLPPITNPCNDNYYILELVGVRLPRTEVRMAEWDAVAFYAIEQLAISLSVGSAVVSK